MLKYKKIIKPIFYSAFFLFFFFLLTPTASAANATMSFSPQSGTIDKPFTVNLVIDGHGEKFNAAEAKLTIPNNFKIKDLVLGDCNFSFLKTPSIQHTSFQGVILSKYATKCTVYSLTLIPVTKGKASITLSEGSIKRYGDAAELFSSSQNGTYTITNVSQASVLGAQTTKQPDKNLYSVTLHIVTQKDNPVTNAKVTLSPVSKKDEVKGTTDSKGMVLFSNIKSGIYSVIVEKNGNKVGETIINVSGTNHTLTLSIDLSTQKDNPLLKHSFFDDLSSSPLVIGGILLSGIIVGVAIPILFSKIKKSSSDES